MSPVLGPELLFLCSAEVLNLDLSGPVRLQASEPMRVHIRMTKGTRAQQFHEKSFGQTGARDQPCFVPRCRWMILSSLSIYLSKFSRFAPALDLKFILLLLSSQALKVTLASSLHSLPPYPTSPSPSAVTCTSQQSHNFLGTTYTAIQIAAQHDEHRIPFGRTKAGGASACLSDKASHHSYYLSGFGERFQGGGVLRRKSVPL